MLNLQLGDFDKDGELASNGTVNQPIKEELMSVFSNMQLPKGR